MEKLTEEQIQFIKQCLYKWNNIASQQGYDTKVQACMANIDHSNLLYRLLIGQEPYLQPPPRAYSYPWTRLIEDGFAEGCEVHFPADYNNELSKVLFSNSVVIEQSRWKLIERHPDYFIAEWEKTELRIKGTKMVNPKWEQMAWRIEIISDATT